MRTSKRKADAHLEEEPLTKKSKIESTKIVFSSKYQSTNVDEDKKVPHKSQKRQRDNFENSEQEGDSLIIQNLLFKNNNFVGRLDALKKLEEEITESNHLVITGMPGLGKTQIARQYAHIHKNKYNVIWWINGKTGVAESYKALGLKLITKLDFKTIYIIWLEHFSDKIFAINDINNEEEKKKLILKEFYTLDENKIYDLTNKMLSRNYNYLLIIDDVENEAQISHCIRNQPFSSKFSHLLITSNNPHWTSAQIFPLEEFSTKEAEELLKSIFKKRKIQPIDEINEENINDLINKIGGLPLVLAQAGAYIVSHLMSINAYIDLFHKRYKVLMNNEIPISDYEKGKTISNILKITIDAIKNEPLIMEFLSYSAFLANEIQVDLLKNILEIDSNNVDVFNKAVRIAKSYSLIESNNMKYFYIHNLTQKVIQNYPEDEKSIYIVNLLKFFNNIKYSEYSSDNDKERFLLNVNHIEKLSNTIMNLNICNQDSLDLLINLGKFYLFEKNDFNKSMVMLQKAKELLSINNDFSIPEESKVILECFFTHSASFVNIKDNNEHVLSIIETIFYCLQNCENDVSPYIKIIANWFLAEFCNFKGNLNLAKKYIEYSINTFEDNYHGSGYLVIANLYRVKAEIYKHSNSFEEAKKIVDKACKYFENSNSKSPIAALIYHEKAEIIICEMEYAFYIKDIIYLDQLKIAEEYLNKSIEIRSNKSMTSNNKNGIEIDLALSNDYLCKSRLDVLKAKKTNDIKYLDSAQKNIEQAKKIIDSFKNAYIYNALLEECQGDKLYHEGILIQNTNNNEKYKEAEEKYRNSLLSHKKIWGPFTSNKIAELNIKIANCIKKYKGEIESLDFYLNAREIKIILNLLDENKMQWLNNEIKIISGHDKSVIDKSMVDIESIKSFLTNNQKLILLISQRVDYKSNISKIFNIPEDIINDILNQYTLHSNTFRDNNNHTPQAKK